LLNDTVRIRLNRLSNRLTKILIEARKAESINKGSN
jgi:hypothetical protein